MRGQGRGRSVFGRFFSELKQRNVIRVAGVYAVTAWALFQVAKTVFETLGLPRWASVLVLVMLTLGLPVTLIISWAFERGPDGGIVRTPRRHPEAPVARLGGVEWALLGGVVVVLAISALQVTGVIGQRPAAPPAASAPVKAADESVAVLPFSNFSERQDAEYFADGLTEELINSLAQIPGLKVAGRTSAFYFKGKNEDLREVGRQLGVSHVVEGSVRRENDRLRVTVQLIKVSDGFHIMSQTYDRQMDDAFAIQTEIANSVANTLKVKLAPAAAAPRERDPEAYRLELVAKAQLRKFGFNELTAARQGFQQVIKLEPDNADAYAGYASATVILAQNHLALDFPTAERDARAAINKAMQLDPRSPSPYIAKALLCRVLVVRTDNQPCLADGEAALQKAVQLAPKDPDALTFYGDELARRDAAASIPVLKQALAIDPLNRVALNALSRSYEATGQLAGAEQTYLSTASLYPDFVDAKEGLALLYVREGKLDRAEPWLRAAAAGGSDPSVAIELANLYLNLGMPQQAAAALQSMKTPIVRPIAHAIELIVAGDYQGLKTLSGAQLKGGDPFWKSALLIADILTGDYDPARQVLLQVSPEMLEPNPTVDRRLAPQAVIAGLICDKLGDHGQARRILQSMLAQTTPKPTTSPELRVERARAFAVLGDKEQALKELRAAIDSGYRQVVGFQYFLRLDRDPALEALRAEPRFKAMIAEIEADNARMRQALTGQAPPARPPLRQAQLQGHAPV